jgi:hypothetical protein
LYAFGCEIRKKVEVRGKIFRPLDYSFTVTPKISKMDLVGLYIAILQPTDFAKKLEALSK